MPNPVYTYILDRETNLIARRRRDLLINKVDIIPFRFQWIIIRTGRDDISDVKSTMFVLKIYKNQGRAYIPGKVFRLNNTTAFVFKIFMEHNFYIIFSKNGESYVEIMSFICTSRKFRIKKRKKKKKWEKRKKRKKEEGRKKENWRNRRKEDGRKA